MTDSLFPFRKSQTYANVTDIPPSRNEAAQRRDRVGLSSTVTHKKLVPLSPFKIRNLALDGTLTPAWSESFTSTCSSYANLENWAYPRHGLIMEENISWVQGP
jgi:hypothetical protein